MSKIFHRVRNLHPARSVFNLTYEKKFTADMGQLIPVMCDEVVPGDVFKIGSQAVIRFQPLVAPIMHEISMTVHYFFVPIGFFGTNGRISSPADLTVMMILLFRPGHPLQLQVTLKIACGIILVSLLV